MKAKFRILLIFWLVLIGLPTLTNAQSDSSVVKQLAGWIGQWEGALEIYTLQGRRDSLLMQMDITVNKTQDSLIWNTTFFTKNKVIEKPYYVAQKEGENVFILDERNTILIPLYKIDNELFNFYRVLGSLMLVRNTLVNDSTMIFSITIIKESEILVSGDGMHEGEEIPKVESYAVTMVQKAILRKLVKQ